MNLKWIKINSTLFKFRFRVCYSTCFVKPDEQFGKERQFFIIQLIKIWFGFLLFSQVPSSFYHWPIRFLPSTEVEDWAQSTQDFKYCSLHNYYILSGGFQFSTFHCIQESGCDIVVNWLYINVGYLLRYLFSFSLFNWKVILEQNYTIHK